VVVKLRLTTTVVLAVLLIGGKPVFCRLGSDGSVGRSGIQSDDFVEFRFADVVRNVVNAGAG